MPRMTDFDNFTGRVNYAASCFMSGVRNSRSFDSCFEMYDGRIVVTALVRRCQKNEKLRNAISAAHGGTFPLKWCLVAEDYKFCRTRKLSAMAKHIREIEQARSEHQFKELEQQINGAAS